MLCGLSIDLALSPRQMRRLGGHLLRMLLFAALKLFALGLKPQLLGLAPVGGPAMAGALGTGPP